MTSTNKPNPVFSSRFELMKVMEDTRHVGLNFHIHMRGRIPSLKELPATEKNDWQQIREAIESGYDWQPEHRFDWTMLNLVSRYNHHYGIHLEGGVTFYRSGRDEKIQVIYDSDSDKQIVEELEELVHRFGEKPKNRVGLIQMSYGNLNVKFVEYRPYDLEITPFLGEDIAALKQEMLSSFNGESRGGLFLIHGKPGTGKTSFIKEVLQQTDKKALFIPPSIAGELGNPNLISLLMDHSDSILIIEDAETVLMKREADNSNAVSNLLNLTDGFPADFLNLNIICTFNTDIGDIDPALLRKGRLRMIKEFTMLSKENAKKLAKEVNPELEVSGPMTVADVCTSEDLQAEVPKNIVGFNTN